MAKQPTPPVDPDEYLYIHRLKTREPRPPRVDPKRRADDLKKALTSVKKTLGIG